MQQVNRRRLIKLAGIGTVVAAGIGIPTAGRLISERREQFQFRATAGLPQPPLPSYATYVVEGSVDLVTGTGLVVSRVLAGHPDARSDIGLPGLGRVIAVTGVEERGSQLALRGIVQDRSQLVPGENAEVQLVIDHARGVVQAPFGAHSVELRLG
jgi:hypothetical protein